MYQAVQQFLDDWAQESSLTSKVLSALTDASLTQAVTETKGRKLGELAWHLATSVTGMLGAGGVQVDGPGFNAPTPTRAQEIADGYRKVSDAAVSALKAQWTDGKLSEPLLLFGRINTTYGGLLVMIVRHQIHHRGQMTILMRQAGLVPPGVYGPNEEESAAMRAGH
ncbi:damage-inducible protein DinB [Cohnella sp. CFH 77786]|uniref:DinB family protein n=1 Tax=Cohnella sp. CFH 77786 TaxID=2662265 RepID=UPI001C60C0CA|nr:DinB family protein [Cohnella sp. CFH 77786]MBW5445305.1 damage-inducible protein DinB [Cohnella sp. CFH 77786]